MLTRSCDDLVHILQNGGSLDLRVGILSTDDLTHLARNMKDNSTLILRDLGQKSKEDLVHISRNAKGKVMFVI